MDERSRQAYLTREAARVEAYRRKNEQDRCEVLTRRAVASLFDLSMESVRLGVQTGRASVAFTLTVMGRDVDLLRLDNVIGCWSNRRPDDLAERLEAMRRDCTTIAMPVGLEEAPQYVGYNILDTTPLVRFEDLDGLDS